MSKKTVKIVSILLTFMMIMSLSTSVFAANNTTNEVGYKPFTPTDMKNSINSSGNASTSIKKIGGSLIGMLQTAGVVVAIVIMIVIGIKYMMGSTADKAEYKKSLMPYLVGAIFIFGAVAVSEMVFQLSSGLTA